LKKSYIKTVLPQTEQVIFLTISFNQAEEL